MGHPNSFIGLNYFIAYEKPISFLFHLSCDAFDIVDLAMLAFRLFIKKSMMHVRYSKFSFDTCTDS